MSEVTRRDFLKYEGFDRVFELYNLEIDPEEMVDLSGVETSVLSTLQQELFFHLENANRPFARE